jgi:hypothetical protein
MELFKRYAVSTLITFGAGFAIAILPDLSHLTLSDLQSGAIVGVLFGAVRAGVKMVIEAFIAWYTSRPTPTNY